MDDFPGIIPRDFGLGAQGKAAPMSSIGPSPRPAWDRDHAAKPPDAFDDVFGAPAKPAYNSVFDGFGDRPPSKPGPVYDRPVYDEDMFVGIPGLKPSSSQLDDVFASLSGGRDHEDDLLRALSGKQPSGSRDRSPTEERKQKSGGLDFDELIPGFGKSEPAPKSEHQHSGDQHSFGTTNKSATTASDDPFADLGTIPVSARPSQAVFVDHLENMKFSSGDTKSATPSGVFDDINVFNEFKKKPDSSVSKETQMARKNINTADGSNSGNSPAFDDITENLTAMKVNNAPQKKEFKEVLQEHLFFDTPIEHPVPRPSSMRQVTQSKGIDKRSDARVERRQEFDNIWLSVFEVPLFTQPTKAPPPSRPPPPLAIRHSSFASTEKVASDYSHAKRNTGISSVPQHPESEMFPDRQNGVTRGFGVPSIDVLEEFASSRPHSSVDDHAGIFISGEQPEANSAAATSAAAMKEAMDRAEAKFKHARELREREKEQRSFKTREYGQQQKNEDATPDYQEQETKETRTHFDFEREQREKEAREERRRIEREREKAEREKAAVEKAMKEAQERAAADARQRAQRAAVEKANAEARERAARAAALRAEAEARAAAEARERAAKEAKEKAAREAREREAREREAKEREAREREAREREVREREARERERAAREREAREKEAREREAREKATRDRERAAVERAAEDARRRAARAAVEKVNAEARERAAAAAAAAAAATAKEKPFKNDNDLDSFFGMGSRANSQPKQRTANTDPFDTHVRNQGGSNEARSSSTGPSSNIRKASSATNILDDLSSVFGGAPPSGEFQDIEGESEERRKARFERHQRTLERAAKALAEKNERDIQLQRDQAERHRIAETLDVEIRRWAAGKEGNIRALLSTMQYVLWPECGWQPVSLTDLITSAAVKKVYRKATLCIHPDKVQQKGANLQQKYIAEKVFDLLKEAWNKFNSEELF